MEMNSDNEDDIAKPEKLPIYQKGKEENLFEIMKR